MEQKNGHVLVAGAGIGGIRTALDLAETGYRVTLIDRAPHTGGILNRLDHQFPNNHCGMCKMLPLIERDAGSQYCLRKGLFHENIDLRPGVELTAIEGEAGHFTVSLRGMPRFVDPERCIGCGDCTAVCPVEAPDDFNAGLNRRKAIHSPSPHAVYAPYVIDPVACTRCGDCAPVCPTGAIRLFQEKRREFNVLVVDDELVVRDSLKEWLTDEGFSVTMAASGEEALALLTGRSTGERTEEPEAGTAEPRQVDVMLLDIKMPGMDGVEVLKKAREAFPDLIVVMMTAYASVETAVEAMKLGARDYLMKPFDAEALVAKIVDLYESREVSQREQLEVGAVIFCGGVELADPTEGGDTLGYGVSPDVVTSLEFERLLGGAGPRGGDLVRLSDGVPPRRIAWIQCVGSRDLKSGSDFCSGMCCMAAVKEAMLARERLGPDLETVIFYMDMRTYNKSFQRYREEAEQQHGVRFERGRVHTVVPEPDGSRLLVRHADRDGRVHDSRFDMVVLSVGQRPAAGMEQLAEIAGIELNSWGFAQTEPFSMARTRRPGIFVGGSFAGLKDISESLIAAGSASLSASLALRASGGGLALVDADPVVYRDVADQAPKSLVVLCECKGALSAALEAGGTIRRMASDPAVEEAAVLPEVCTGEGWRSLVEKVRTAADQGCNRVLIGACRPYVHARRLKALGAETFLDPVLMEAVDIRGALPAVADQSPETVGDRITGALRASLAKLKRSPFQHAPPQPVTSRALVAGGGAAGMTAALAIADHGYPVTLVEKAGRTGGNLNWLEKTVEGFDVRALLEELRQRVEKHPLIETLVNTRVVGGFGRAGVFLTTVETEGGGPVTIEHGAVILATGGNEATPSGYGYGESPFVVTQKELTQKLAANEIDSGALRSVVMIQCAGTREEPRNYCSRVCCAETLKHILDLKRRHPDLPIYVFYRDMMAYGFKEHYFTEARNAGAVFIPYDPDNKPRARVRDGDDMPLRITGREPILGMDIEIDADLLVLGAGIVPDLPGSLADAFGATLDGDGFFQEAEAKWRPVDALREGVFACGIALGPRSVTETIATAEAAAQRALRILSTPAIRAGVVTARVRDALCAGCEQCIGVCPYNARWMDPETGKARIHAVMCQGCGACAAVCPGSAAVLETFSDQCMFETIDASLEGVRNGA